MASKFFVESRRSSRGEHQQRIMVIICSPERIKSQERCVIGVMVVHLYKDKKKGRTSEARKQIAFLNTSRDDDLTNHLETEHVSNHIDKQ